MLFNSFQFLLFFPIVVLLYYIIPSVNSRKLLLILAGVIFILQANFISLIVIGVTTIVNYFLGITIGNNIDFRKGKIWFVFGILFNVLILGFFKYFLFFTDNINYINDLLGFGVISVDFNIILPLGISFYTFQLISYLIEVYIGSMKAEFNFVSFTNYVFYFPKLLAGPVERADNFLSQFKSPVNFHWNNISEGLQRILWGLFKKIVVADRIAIYTSSVFTNYENHNGTTLIIASIFYVFQLYADFSGYTDIALGIAKMMGINLMENFKFPLYSKSVTEFWRRWHISLSSWANDYIYTPINLKYRKLDKASVIIGLFFTFFVIGIWHGPTWGFVLFGVFQGIVIIYEMQTESFRRKIFQSLPKSLAKGIGITVTLSFFSLTCIFFNYSSINHTFNVYTKIFTDFGVPSMLNPSTFTYSLFGIISLLSLELYLISSSSNSFLSFKSKWLLGLFWNATLIIIILVVGVFDGGQFIYFQF